MDLNEKMITYKGKVVFIKIYMPAFKRALKQYAENEACFMFINDGSSVDLRSQQEHMSFNKSTAMLAKCMNYFFERDSKKHEGVSEAIGIFMYPSMVEELFEFDLSQSNFTLDYNVTQVQVDRLLENCRNSIDILLDTPELADESMIKNKLKEFILLVAKSQGAPSQLDFLSALFRPKEIEFQTIIQNNLYANLSLEELATLCHLSLSSFKRKFAEVYSESPKKYLSKKKIEKAAELLKDKSNRVTDVAYEVGFDSMATFSRNFHTVFGQSPTEYRG